MAENASTSSIKALLWTVGGVCAAAVGLLVWNPYKKRIVEDLANSLHTPHTPVDQPEEQLVPHLSADD
ncbi:hypothetical protein GCM10011507_19610 [Edaphobacter acidisoli]|uniref:Uncharacterized protein n=1 Tax=Edaphobacter acidisoli TaxID=2040573 RepID=A0A916RTG4_9BACT|nr:hypothetical protein [Edaphobacter acidisoli]GGA68177.1 hypothetical protein GCM10011507_19610 [Edaphobacter acidisoli]